MRQRYYPLALLLLLLVMTSSFLAGHHYQLLAAGGDTVLLPSLQATTAEPVGSGQKGVVADDVDLRPLEAVQEVLDSLRQHYVDKVDDNRALTYGAIRGMLRSLNDPYTRFLEAKDFTAFQRESEGHFDGIGATLGMTEIPAVPNAARSLPSMRCPNCGADLHTKMYRVTITTPIPGNPASKAGLRAGDYILKVDGKSTDGMDLTEAVNLIRGQAGTGVTLTIGRKGLNKPKEIKITRGVIEIPTVEHRMLEGKLGYLRLNVFNENTAEATREALGDLEKQGMRGMLLDVRNNPGGLLKECVEVSRQFVGKRPVVYIQERGGARKPYKGPDIEAKDFKHPLVMLINGGTASASEILSGAIQDYGMAKLVGTNSYGKGLVQTVLPLSDGSALMLTTARYFTPKGRDINKKGIAPDKVVELPADTIEYVTDKDRQYLEALSLLRKEVAALPAK